MKAKLAKRCKNRAQRLENITEESKAYLDHILKPEEGITADVIQGNRLSARLAYCSY
jgi:hypothetical protein